MTRVVLAPAAASDLTRLTTALVAARLFRSRAEIEAVMRAEPWRVQVNGRGDAVVLDRWRDHLDLLAIEALWCAERSIPRLVRELEVIAASRGFAGVVSPVVPAQQAHAYEAAGMRIAEEIVSWRLEPLRDRPGARVDTPAGVSLRAGKMVDLPRLLEVDAASFDPFWRYDARRLRRLLDAQRVVIAEGHGTPIGYTLSTVDRGLGQLSRLCVMSEWRRRGVGRALVEDVIRSAAERSAERLVLCMQADNAAAARLYRDAGFRERADRAVLLRSD